MKKKWSLLTLITLLAVSITPHAASSNSVNLYVTVVEPEYLVFSGAGYLYIDDQTGWGKAVLYVPADHAGPVKLEIHKRNQVTASWMWGITEHTEYSREFRKFDYTRDKYICEDSMGRVLRVYIYGYYWDHHQNIYAIGYGEGAGFQGNLI